MKHRTITILNRVEVELICVIGVSQTEPLVHYALILTATESYRPVAMKVVPSTVMLQ